MLLDNHYGPDPRVAFETGLLQEAGIATRILAWDRRAAGEAEGHATIHRLEIIRIAVPAPRGGGWRSLVAVLRFGARVWRRHKRLLDGASLLIVHDVYLLPLGWFLARRVRLPFIYDAHEDYARMEAGRYPGWLLRTVTVLESRLARSAQAVVVPGASRTTRWDGILVQPPIVLPNLISRDRPPLESTPTEWDLLYVGGLSESRRPEILVELAHLRPDLRIGIAGGGRRVAYVSRAANGLPNLTFLGWRSDPHELVARTKILYYGLDPDHPYSEIACPNTLYESLLHRKPLIFLCGGEPAELAKEFTIGIRCAATAQALSAAVDEVSRTAGWQFDEAWQAVWERAGTHQFVETIEEAVRQSS
jgi:glycosyltransferase involved in cell wall biosynthesis